MSDPALSPAQLDLLEDALEDLEHGGLPSALLDVEEDDDARAVGDTLEVYRSILVMSRQALPTEDVPPGLLDDVLAEARRAAAAPAKAERPVPWYRRLGGWGPALAFAGTAALLVVLVRPMSNSSSESEAPAIAQRQSEERKAERAPASAADETPTEAPAAVPAGEADADADAEAKDAGDLDGLKLADAQGKAEARDAWDDLGGEAAEGRGAGADTARREKTATKLPAGEAPGGGVVGGTSKSSSSSADKKAKGDVYEPKPAPKANATPRSPPPQTTGPLPSSGGAPSAEPAKPVTKPGDTEEKKKEAPDGWADVATGDAKRRAGACSSAKTAYQRAVEDDSAEVRARALAGLGLCELDAGNTSAAESLFAKARKTDPKVDELIAAERARHEPKDEAQADQAAPP